jgi:hypothetical protein
MGSMFDFHYIYDLAVTNGCSGDMFAEVGSWKGESTNYLCDIIKKSKKNIEVVCVDTWGGDVHTGEFIKGVDLYKQFLLNTRSNWDIITPIRMDSWEVSKLFADKEIRFTFIDGDHHYGKAKGDVQLWLPKTNWLLAGHDYQHPPIKKICDELLPGYKINKNSWYYLIK